MKELLEYLARGLVDKTDAVNVTVDESEQSVNLQLRVDPEEIGKVIGKQGRIAKAIRTVVKASAAKEGRRVLVEIVD